MPLMIEPTAECTAETTAELTTAARRTGTTVLLRAVAPAALCLLLAGCGMFGGAQEATPIPTRTPVPTYTPTATGAPAAAAPTDTPVPPPATPAPVVAAAPLTATGALTATDAATTTQAAAPAAASGAAPAAGPMLTIAGDLVNLRSGPGTEFDLVGEATNGQQFTVVGKNPAGDWWQVCCINGAQGWVFGELASVSNAEAVAVAADLPAEPTAAPAAAAATEAPVADAAPAATAAQPAEATGTPAPAAAAPYDPNASSAGNFDPNAQYQIVNFRVLGLDENNGGIRDSSSQHLIFVTVLDANGNGIDGAIVRDLAGDEKLDYPTGNKGPGKTEIFMYIDPFKLAVASDPSGPVTSQVSNQMSLYYPHLPDIVGKLGDVNYEYGACPTLEIKCEWPIKGIHFSYDITFQKVK